MKQITEKTVEDGRKELGKEYGLTHHTAKMLKLMSESTSYN